MTTASGKKSMTRWVAILIPIITVGTAYWLWSSSQGDPADSFEVLRVVTDAQARRHAVVYRYDHANSSTRSIAVWIASGQAPAIGSRKPADGEPALVLPGIVDTLKLKWFRPEERLLAELDAGVSVSERFQDCYFEYDRTTFLVCVDTSQAELRIRAVGS